MNSDDILKDPIYKRLYDEQRSRGDSHESAINQVTYLKYKTDAINSEAEEIRRQEQLKNEYRNSPEFLELTSYYRKKAISCLFRLIIFGAVIYFMLKDYISNGAPLTLKLLSGAGGFALIIAFILWLFMFFASFFGNYLIGSIVCGGAVSFILAKGNELMDQYAIDSRQQEIMICLLGAGYYIFNLTAFITNLKKSINP